VVIPLAECRSSLRATTGARAPDTLSALMRRRTLLTVICALSALAAVSAPASAASKVETARFRATLSGQQTSSWTLNQSNACGSITGSGKQTFTYHQKRAVTLVFTQSANHGGPPFIQVAHWTLGIPVTGTVSREGKLNNTTTNPNCRGTPIGPPQAPPAPDCGTKHYDGFFDVRWYRPQDFPSLPGEPVPLDNSFALDEEQPQIQFLHCPFNGPLIMQRLTHALLPANKVFGGGKHLALKANVHRVDQDQRVGTGVRAETTVRWTMNLTRVLAKAAHHAPR
jgi:hypothetical protein